MAHLFESGFTVREPAWHGLATVLDAYPGRQEAMRAAGHQFKTLESPALTRVQGKVVKVPGWKALRRATDGRVISLVRDSYQVVQNEVLWDIVDALVSQPSVQYETAGVLKGGAVLWVLARLAEPRQIKGDTSYILPYVSVSTSHDGSSGCKAQCTSVRIVCWNTYTLAGAESRRTGLEYTFRHTRRVMERIEQAKAALGLVREQFSEFMELAEELAGHEVDRDGVKEFLARFIPDPPAEVSTERVKENIREARLKVLRLLEGPTTAEAHRRTSYGLWCAGVEYLDHLRSFRSPETYFTRTVFDPTKAKDRLAKLALSVASS